MNTKRVLKADSDKLRTVEFQVDTLVVSDGAGAYYSDSNNSVTINHIRENEDFNKWSHGDDVITHEIKHKDNQAKGMYAYALSPEQAYKVNMHDEISANIAELLTLRDKYIKTGDINVFETKEERFHFYKKAIQNGTINPKSNYAEDFNKEMSLIANGTKNMWMEKFANSSYIEQNSVKGASYGEIDGKHAKYYNQNYERAKKIAYGNIGGVDFTKYMKGDIEIPKEAYSYMINNFQKAYTLSNAEIFKKSGFPKYEGNMTLTEYKQLLQHQLAINNFVKNHNLMDEHGNTIKYKTLEEYYQKIQADMKKNSKHMYETLMSAKNAQELKKQYPNYATFYKGYVSEYSRGILTDFREELNSAKNNALIDRIVEYQAAEYAKRGKLDKDKEFDIQFDGNGKNYQAALKNMYGNAYTLLKPNNAELNCDLSDRTNLIITESNKSTMDRIRENWNELTHRYTHVKDENGNEKEVGFLGKVEHKLEQIKTDLTTCVEIDEKGNPREVECSVFTGLKNKIVGWFEDLTSSDEVTNEIIHPINNKAPEYRKWKNEDGSRVSPVQKKQILDMNKEIIAKPQEYKKKAPHIEQPSSLTVAREPIPTKIKLKNDKTAQKKLKKNMLGATRKNSPTKNKAKNNKGKGAIVATKHTVQKATKLRTQSNSR